MIEMVKPGQIWRHVGAQGIPATGLLVRIREVHAYFFYADYPPEGMKRRYAGLSLGPCYEPVSKAEARKHLFS